MENDKKSQTDKGGLSSFGCFGIALVIMIALWALLSPYLPASLGALIPLTVIFLFVFMPPLFSGGKQPSSFTGTPKSAEDYIKRGSEKYISKNDEVGAIEDYTKAIELDPGSSDAYYSRALAKESSGDLNGALADLNKAIELNPEYQEAYLERGQLRNELREFMDAIADFTKAIELFPEDEDAYLYRGVAKYELHDYNGAIADYDEVIKLNPKNYGIHSRIKEAINKLHDLAGAQTDFAKAEEITQEYSISEYEDMVTNDEFMDKKEAVPEMTRPQYEVTYTQNKTVIAKDDHHDKRKTITDFTRPDYDVSYSKRRLMKWIILILIALAMVAVGLFLRTKEKRATKAEERQIVIPN
jgi:tetratricopeptide (TPR) repeat protein